MPRITMAIASIGIISFIVAILLFVNNNAAQTDHKQVGSSTNNTDSHQVLGSQNIPGDSAVTGQNADQGDTSTRNTAGAQHSSPIHASGGAASGTNSTLKKPPVSSSPSTSTPSRTGYNLNENWYLATAGAEGLFNSCWPTELNETNEAQCIDESNPYSRYWFEGVGISKSVEEAHKLAEIQVNQKAYDKHVDLRRGGGDDAVILTESLCSAYGLVCGRW